MKRLVLALTLALGGCATGITMNDDEAKACKEQGCSVWTEQELQMLIRRVFTDGYIRGRAAEKGST